MKTVQKMHATINTCTSGAVEGMETAQKIDANFIGFSMDHEVSGDCFDILA
jgi:hypothetical protein